MPWTSKDAHGHTHKAKSPVRQRQWEHVANGVLKRTGDEGLAVREANGVIKHQVSFDSHKDHSRNGR